MTFRYFICFLFIAYLAAPALAQAPKLDPANTHAVIVGVLSWEQESLTTYAKENRQDVALFEQLHAMGVPKSNMSLLLDEAASRDAIEKAVDAAAGRAGQGSTLIVYYAGHGMRNGNEGIFACYDIRTSKMQETGWRLSKLQKTIGDKFRGDQVLFFADCCFSGALKEVTIELADAKINAASLTSASSANTSTNNWTYTVGLIDILKGQPFADTDDDGVITLAEAAYEMRKSMLYYERQRNGFSLQGLSADFQLARSQPKVDSKDADQLNNLFKISIGDFVTAKTSGGRKAGRVVGERPGQFQVEFQEYSKRRREWVAAELVHLIPQIDLKPILPPAPLPAKEAKEKATVDGKYSELLLVMKVESDFSEYGEFREYGKWNGVTYAGHKNVPAGYWVYVYPNWYIWKQTRDPLVFQQKEEPVPSNTAKDLQRDISRTDQIILSQQSRIASLQAVIDRYTDDLADVEKKRAEMQKRLEQLKQKENMLQLPKAK